MNNDNGINPKPQGNQDENFEQPTQQPQYDSNQYGQQQQYDSDQYGQQPQYGQYPGQSFNQPEPPPKKSPMPKFIIAAVALTVTVGIVAISILNKSGGERDVFSNNDPVGTIGGVTRSADPEKYLQASFEKSAKNIELAARHYPDFSRFAGVPVEQSISLEVLDIMDSDELVGASADIILKIDESAGKYLMDFSIGYGGLSLNNNRIFFSNDLIALSLPDLYSRHQYISIDPHTFVDDWNSSDFGYMMPLDPAGLVEFTNLIEANAEMEADAERLMEELAKIAENSLGDTSFSDEGTEDIAIAGKQIKAAKLSYSLSPQQSEEFLHDMLLPIYAYMEKSYGYLIPFGDAIGGGYYNPYQEAIDEMDEAFDEIRNISFPNGVSIVCYVNEDTGYISRVALDDFLMSHSGNDVSMGLQIDMLGDDSITDDFAMTLTVRDSSGETAKIVVTNNTTRGNVVSDNITLYVETDGSKAAEIVYTMSWEPSAGGENFHLGINMDIDYDSVEISLRGNMTDTSEGIFIKDGVLDVGAYGQTMASMGFGYGIRSISAGDVDIDRSQAADLFSLDMVQLQQDLMAGIMRYSSIIFAFAG